MIVGLLIGLLAAAFLICIIGAALLTKGYCDDEEWKLKESDND